ncbi:hypothetical protein F511_19073 [Dorcoceras hygrometricum]|uniref:Uncharacterized protein n=1 Tax=Dorcoceras hygrometricum TaxID=472368 RepID=A0A2Z7D340_9LAMI|nr:hypothetical protein F511_19073 [Dorcoceras hygrometricum]
MSGGRRRHHLARRTRPRAAATCAAHGGVPPSIMRKTAAHQECNGWPLSRTFVAQPSAASALAIVHGSRWLPPPTAVAGAWLQPEITGKIWLFSVGGGRSSNQFPCGNHESSTCVTLNGSGIQLAVGPQPLRLRNHNFGLAHRIMVKHLATSSHDPLGITDSACKNHLVVVSVQYGPFNTFIPIRSTTIGKSRVARDPIAMHTSWRSNSDIASVTSIGYPRMKASGESSTTKHRLLHASGPHPIPPPNDPKTNQYNQDLGLIHSTNGNHLESPNEGSSIDHQVTIHLHAQNITMFPTNETWYFTSQMLVSSSGGLILILTAQSTRNEFRIHSFPGFFAGRGFDPAGGAPGGG